MNDEPLTMVAEGDMTFVAYDKSKVKDAPPVDAEDEPSEEQVAAVYRHYGIDPNAGSSASTVLRRR